MSGLSVKNSFLWLLLSLVAFFIVTPFVVNSEIDLYVFGMLFTVVLYAGIFVITKNRWLVITGAILATLIVISLWTNNLIIESPILLGVEYCLMTIYFLGLTLVVLNTVFRQRKVTFNTICGAICGYLLIGMSWSFIYSVIYFFQSSAFSFPDVLYVVFDSHFQRFSYYSFVTLTTLGYGDITPVSNLAKTFAWVEAVVGQVYLTVWIAQLVALHVTQRTQQKGN